MSRKRYIRPKGTSTVESIKEVIGSKRKPAFLNCDSSGGKD